MRHIVLVALFLTVAGCNSSSQLQQAQQPKPPHCHAQNALPDSSCTSGAVFANVTTAQVCTSGYASSVRNVPYPEKLQAYQEYGITHHSPGQYEVDHLISLELGGSNDIKNLWAEAAQPVPGFHEKDQVENYLHDQVCSGKIALKDVQHAIATNWKQFLNSSSNYTVSSQEGNA